MFEGPEDNVRERMTTTEEKTTDFMEKKRYVDGDKENSKRQKVSTKKVEPKEEKCEKNERVEDEKNDEINENQENNDQEEKRKEKGEESTEVEPNEMADNIASTLIKMLVEQFKQKEGRDPDESELEALFSELTEERISELMSIV